MALMKGHSLIGMLMNKYRPLPPADTESYFLVLRFVLDKEQ